MPLFLLVFILIFIVVSAAGSEIVFWNEFNVRYNFIAVDYLVYTNEVLGNIQEWYNMPLIILVVIVLTLLILFLVRRWLTASQLNSMGFGKRTICVFYWYHWQIIF